MKFAPKSADELAQESLLEPGLYPFEVQEAIDTWSQAGNEMIKLKILAFGKDGATTVVFDYLLEKLAYKLRHFAEGTGLLAAYEAGELTAAMCVNREGYCKLAVEKQGEFPPRNVVKDYLPKEKSAAKPEPQPPKTEPPKRERKAEPAHPAFDDDIPPF